MVVEFMLRGLKTEIDTDTFISLLKAGNDIENEYIIGVIQELVAKCEALEPLNNSILDLLSIRDKQTKDIDRLEAELKQLKEENEKAKSAERIKKLVSKIKEQKEMTEFYKNQCEELRKTCNKLREENASIKNDKSELIFAIKNTRHDIKMTADYLDSIVNAFHGNNKFDWEKFKLGGIAVHCSTIKEAKDFINKSKQYIKTWRDGDKIDEERTYWETHENETCYAYNNIACYAYYEYNNIGLMISSREISHNCGREILEWSDYMVKHDE